MLQYTQDLIDFFTIMDIAFPLIIFYQYYRVLPMFVVQAGPSLIALGECGGIAPAGGYFGMALHKGGVVDLSVFF